MVLLENYLINTVLYPNALGYSPEQPDKQQLMQLNS